MSGVATVPAMSAVHEYVHKRASKEWQPNEETQYVSAVLGEQKRAGNDEKADQD
jgi:hypothetical protein